MCRSQATPKYVDDNFGVWQIAGQDDIDFYHDVQARSVRKNCFICGKAVKILPEYDKCNSCTAKIEAGQDPEPCDPANYEPLTTEQD